MRVAGRVLASFLGGACTSGAPIEEETSPVPTVEWTGCHELDRGSCVLTGAADALDIWIDTHAATALAVHVDGRAVAFERRPAAGGVRIRVTPGPRSERVAVVGLDPPWARPWSLPVRHRELTGVLTEVRPWIASNELPKASDALVGAMEDLDPDGTLEVLQQLRKLHRAMQHPEASLHLAIQAADLAAWLGHPLQESEAAAAAAFQSAESGDFEAAWAWVERLGRLEPRVAEARILGPYHAATLKALTGDLAGAVESIERSRIAAERLGDVRHASAAYQKLASWLAETGRTHEALTWVERALVLVDDPVLPCRQRAQLLNSLGWVELLSWHESGDLERPRERFEIALQMLDDAGACPDQGEAANVRINLALTELEDDEPDRAWAWVADIENVPPSLVPWVEQVAARVALTTGRASSGPSMLHVPDPSWSLALQWNAWEHQARLRDRFGFTEASIEAARVAEELVERDLSAIGSGSGAELFLAGRGASARLLVRLLLQEGRLESALCAARLARGRGWRRLDRLASLQRAAPDLRASWNLATARVLQVRARHAREEREDWKLSDTELDHAVVRRARELAAAERGWSDTLERLGADPVSSRCEDLPAWEPRERVIVVFPLDHGWAWFSWMDGVTTARDIDLVHPADLGAASNELLATLPWTEPLPRRIRILPTGAAWEIPFAATPLVGGALIDIAPIVYGLDLPPRIDTGARRAVVLADPSGDLPQARVEAQRVEARLLGAGWDVLRRSGEQVRRSVLSDQLERAALLHYAGHGIHGGQDGWQAALMLPGGDRLGVLDVLSLPHVPGSIVLTGCDTGRVSGDLLTGGMNMGTSFLLAGAGQALVTDDRVDDELAAVVGAGLYDPSRDPRDLPERLRAVQRQVRDRDPSSPWHSFRVIAR